MIKTYLVRCEGTGLIKIGKTRNVDLRLSMLQTGSASKLTVAHVFNEDIERKLHKKFNNVRKHGEWFDVSLNEVIEFVEKIKLSLEKRNTPSKAGPLIKYKWLEDMPVGKAYKVPDGMSLANAMVAARKYGKKTGKVFAMVAQERLIGRTA